jgi:hypothetical protein
MEHVDQVYVPNIILFGQAEESSDLGGTLGTQSFRVDDIGEAGNVIITLLDDGESEDGEILTNNAASN